MNKQVADKRQKFRQQIRRRHIDQIFRKARKQLIESKKNEGFTHEHHNKKEYIDGMINDFMRKSFLSYHGKDYVSLMKDINKIKREVDINPLLISASLNKILQQRGSNLMDFMKKDVSKSALDKLYLQINQNPTSASKIQQQFSYETNISIVCELMNISAQLQYNKFCLQSAVIILKPIWNVLDGNWHLVDKQHQQLADKNLKILNNTCISLSKLLQGPHQQVIKRQLKQMGLHQKLYKIINLSSSFDLETNKNLLTLVYYFNTINLEEVKNQYDLTGGITITSSVDQFKSKYTQYCIKFLVKKVQSLYNLAMQTLTQIFEQNSYYVDKFERDFFTQVLDFVVSDNRQTNVIALNLLRIIVFSSMPACDQLVENKAILDYLYGRLVMEKQMPKNQPSTKKSIDQCSIILCDLLMTRDTKIKKIMFKHHIWQLLYESLNEGSQLFHTAIVFKYFFECFGRSQRKKVLPSFLQAVSHLHLQNQLVPEIKELKQTLYNIFYFSMEHNSEEAHNQVLHLYQINGLLKYIQAYQAQFEKMNQKQLID